MSQAELLKFLIPPTIQKGLDSNDLEIVGGVIRRVDNGEIVLWLNDNPDFAGKLISAINTVADTANVISYITPDVSCTLAFASFTFLLKMFENKAEQMQKVFETINRTQVAFLKSGLQLAQEAESILDSQHAILQIVNARQSIQQGISFFVEEIKNTQKQIFFRKSPAKLVDIFVVGELAITRTYLWTNDYQLAKNRLLSLQLRILQINVELLEQLKKSLPTQLYWRYELNPLRFVSHFAFHLALGGGSFLGHLIGAAFVAFYLSYRIEKATSFEEIIKQNKNLTEEIKEKRYIADKLLEKIKQVCTEFKVEESKILPSELEKLTALDSFIEGYLAEVECFKGYNAKPTRDLLNSLPTAQKL